MQSPGSRHSLIRVLVTLIAVGSAIGAASVIEVRAGSDPSKRQVLETPTEVVYVFFQPRSFSGQREPERPPGHASTPHRAKTVDSGVLNNQARSLPDPAYPAAARAAGITGTVKVKVTFDEWGNVIGAKAVSGPVRLRAAAVSAARGARFAPAQLNGSPVKVSGLVIYRFRRGGVARAVRSRSSGKNVLSSTDTDLAPKVTEKVTRLGNPDGEEDGTTAPQISSQEPASETGAPPNVVTPPRRPTVISGGVLNGKAISLPKPAYPPTARAVGASGKVNVQVTIDEEGNVISAVAVSGHVLLRAAAAAAARASKFSPTKLAGVPVKVTGTIIYNFAPMETPPETAPESPAPVA